MDSDDSEQTAMIDPSTTDSTTEDEIALGTSAIRTPLKGATFCTPPLFFTIAGLLLLFLVGSNLFMFVSANLGNAPGLEITNEPEMAVILTERSGTEIARRGEEHSGEATPRRTAVTKQTPRGNVVRVNRSKLLPGRSLLCILGGRAQEYGVMRLDGLCDVVFVPFYALPKGGDTLLNDGHRITQEVLEVAAKSVRTTYGIHVPLSKVSRVMKDLKRNTAQNKIKRYWMKNNIYHYALLDLQVGKNDTNASDVVGRVFALLKKFRDTQNKIRRAASTVASKRHRAAFVVLGVRPHLATNKQLFKAIEKHWWSFAVSAFIIRTHISDTKAPTPHDGCKMNGPAPYKIKKSKRIMGMADAVSYARKFSWVKNTTLVVSFTLCTRRYRPKAGPHIGAECLKDANRAARSSSSALCSERPDFYANQAIDKIQLTAYSWRNSDEVATYDTADTMRWKICSLEKAHRRLNLSVALFDAECEDWRGKCVRPSSSHMRGSKRMRNLHAYLHRLSRMGKNASTTCA